MKNLKPDKHASQTLFRFASIRNPKLSDEIGKPKRFIFQPKSKSQGVFHTATADLTTTVDKLLALNNAAASYGPLTKAELKALNTELFIFSEWLARNRSTFQEAELYTNANGVSPLDTQALYQVWNNLYYQIITQQDPYVKDALIHLLVANHVILNLADVKKLADDIRLDCLEELVFAKVVLPKEIFGVGDSPDDSTPAPSDQSDVAYEQVPASLDKEMKANIAAHQLKQIAEAKVDVDRMEEKYLISYQAAYDKALDAHEANVQSLITNYKDQVAAAEAAWCELRGDKPYDPENPDPCDKPQEVRYPTIPEFKFEYGSELAGSVPTKALTKSAANYLTRLSAISQFNTFDELKKLLQDEEERWTTIMLDNTVLSNKKISISGTVISDKEEAINSIIEAKYNLVVDASKAKTATSSDPVWEYYMDLRSFDEDVAIKGISYSITYDDGSEGPSGSAIEIIKTKGNAQISAKLFPQTSLVLPEEKGTPSITINILLLNDETLEFSQRLYPNSSMQGSYPRDPSKVPYYPYGKPFIPRGFGVRQLGIADYRKVEQSVHCYLEGEVSHIENIMAREYKEKSTRRLRSTENTTSTTSEAEKEQLTDTTTTDRFEMQNEVSQVLSENESFSASTSFSAGWGAPGGPSFNLGLGANYATHTSSEESINQAVTEAQEITERAMDRVVQRVKEERITKVLEEYEETNKHGFDNTKGNKHIVGVYRWVDKIYKNQIFNYGKRLMYEFMIPQPSKLHRLAMMEVADDGNGTTIAKPKDPRENGLEDSSKISNANFKTWAAAYNAEVVSKPESTIYVGKAFSYTTPETSNKEWDEVAAGNEDYKLPEGYRTTRAKAIWHHSQEDGFGTHVLVGGIKMFPTLSLPIPSFVGVIPISYSVLGHHSGSVNVELECVLTDEAYKQWQLDTFNAIIAAYKERLAEYEALIGQEVEQVDVLKESNPLFYRDIEQMVLRKNCISYLISQSPFAPLSYGKQMYTGSTLKNHEVAVTPYMDSYTAFAKFFEQAFEWEIMSYMFYPFYWGNRKEWCDLYQFENNDPLYRNFMQAGLARVVLTVRPGFEEAVMHYKATGQIWNGGDLPVLDDPLYLSIVDELNEPIGIKEGKAWKTRVPTSLTILQADSAGLKVERALPCNCDDIEDFQESDQTECSSQIVNDETVFENLQVGDNPAPAASRKISFTIQNMDSGYGTTIGEFDDEAMFPRKYECMGQEIVINRDANWDPTDSIEVIFEILAEQLSLIPGVHATQVYSIDNQTPDSIRFTIDPDVIPVFSFKKPGYELSPDFGLDVFEVITDSSSVRIIYGPASYKVPERLLDKSDQPIQIAEIDTALPLNRFLV